MHYHIVTLFPEWFRSPLETSLFAKAQQSGIVDVSYINPRDFTEDIHNKVDDRPYGGGPGMLLMAQPILDAIKSIPKTGTIIALTPSGEPLTQKLAQELSKESDITLLCGRYEGFDERIFSLLPIRRVSVGEAILNGGEVAALALIEATARLQNGYMGKIESGEDESYNNGLLEYPHYTRPETYEGLPVPEVLQNGNHAHINTWRHEAALKATLTHRPDMLEHNNLSVPLSYKDRDFLNTQILSHLGKNIHMALVHHPVLLKAKTVGTSSITNLDLHDIARISCTYGLSSFQVISPLEDQERLLKTLLTHWTTGSGAQSNPDRSKAFRLVQPAKSLTEACENISQICGTKPILVGTSAQPELDKKGREVRLATPFPTITKVAHSHPILIVLGTSHGLAPEALTLCDYILPPIRWSGSYNHLPVRAACAIILDRLLGDMG